MTTSLSLLDRAKAVIKSQARLGALVIVPLALAVPGHAGSIVLPIGGASCGIIDGSNPSPGTLCSSGSFTASRLGVGGVSFSVASGGLSLFGNGTLSESATGQVTSVIPNGTSISYAYDFFLGYSVITSGPTGDAPTGSTWTLTLAIADEGAAPGPATVFGATPGLSGSFTSPSTEFTGSGSITTFNSTNANDYIEVYYNLQLTGVPGNALVTVQVPAGSSVDFNTSSPPGVPEPASLSLMGSGLAWLGWKLRRRRKK